MKCPFTLQAINTWSLAMTNTILASYQSVIIIKVWIFSFKKCNTKCLAVAGSSKCSKELLVVCRIMSLPLLKLRFTILYIHVNYYKNALFTWIMFLDFEMILIVLFLRKSYASNQFIEWTWIQSGVQFRWRWNCVDLTQRYPGENLTSSLFQCKY